MTNRPTDGAARRIARSATLLLLLLLLLPLLVSCAPSRDAPKQDAGNNLTALLLKTDTRGEDATAGVAFKVDCRAFRHAPSTKDAPGDEVPLPAPATLLVTSGPANPEALDGTTAVFNRAGLYAIACLVAEADLQDHAPPLLEVRAGPPVQPQTRVVSATTGEQLTKVSAGTLVRVLCDGKDAHGNDGQGWSVTSGGVAPAAQHAVPFKLTQAGTATFACAASGSADLSPAMLEVKAAPPKHLWTKLNPPTVQAGHAAEVSCTAKDAWGNAVIDFPFSVYHSPKLTLKKLYVTTTAAGQHAVKCVPESIDWKLFEIHGALLDVKAGAPASLLIAKVPDKGVYKRNSDVRFVPLVRDLHGNTVTDWPLAMTVPTPKQGYKVLANQPGDWLVRFQLDGTYQISFAATGTQLSSVTDVLVDGAPPLLTIDAPPWGSTLNQKPSVQVTGTAGDDGAGIKDLFVNGIKTFPDAADQWFMQVGAKHGLNMMEAVVTDLGEQQTRATRGFYYSDSYYPIDANKPKQHRVPAGIQLFMGQSFFDDGDHDSNKPNDIATIIEMIVESLTLPQLVPGGLSGGGTDITLSNLKMGKPTAQLTTHDGGLEVRLRLSALSVDVKVKAKVALGPIKSTIQAKGTLTVTSVKVGSWLNVTVKDGKVTASATSTKAEITGMKLAVSGLAGLFNPVFNLLLNGIKSDIEQQVQKALATELPKTFAQIFAALTINDTVEVDPLVPGAKDKVTLGISSELASVELRKSGLIAKLDVGFSSAPKVPHANLGAIARSGCVGVQPDTFHLDDKARLQVALHDDVINQALWALWNGGALSGVIHKGTLVGQGVAAIPLETATVKLDPLLPPILEGCPSDTNANDPMTVRLQLGDAMSSIDVYSNDLVRLDVVVHMDAPIQLAFHPDFNGAAALIATHAPKSLLVKHELHGLSKQLEDSKWAWIKAVDTLVGQVFENGLPGFEKPLVIPLPSTKIDLSAMVPGAPVGAAMHIAVSAMQRKAGYGALTLQLH